MRRLGTFCAGLAFVGMFAVSALAQNLPKDVHHKATLDINPSQQTIVAHDTITLTAGGRLNLTLHRPFFVTRATLNGQDIQPVRDGEQLILDLGSAKTHVLELSYKAANHPGLETDGSFLGVHWLATPSGVPSTWQVEVSAPVGQKVIVSGALKTEETDQTHYRAHFESPMPDTPPVLLTGPYAVKEKMVNGVRLRTYFHTELADFADDYLNDTARYIQYYANAIGPYPYPGFSIISANAPVGWGLPGMTYMGRRVLALPFIRYSSLPHEVLHNWWGNAIEVAYEDGNWAEGLTTYQSDYAMAEAAKDGGGREKRLEWLRNFAALPDLRDVPLNQFTSKSHDASQVVGYGKSAFVFHMLKSRLGDDIFVRALQRFARDNLQKAASWRDVQAAFESESSQDLALFFDTWISRKGAPELNLSDVERTPDGVSFRLSQIQEEAPFVLSVPITVETSEGTQTHLLDMTMRAQDFRITTQGKVSSLDIDPNFDLFRRLDASQTPPILRDITLDPNAALVALGPQSMRASARNLTGHLLQSRLRMLDPDDSQTIILAGPSEQVQAYLKRKAWPTDPQTRIVRGDARAWTTKTQDAKTLLVIEAKDVRSFDELARVLPHYKRRSFVVMHKGKTTDNGTWPIGKGPLHFAF